MGVEKEATGLCLCNMCQCGDHSCLQQVALQLPETLQDLAVREPSSWRFDPEMKRRICQAFDKLPQTTRYTHSVYRTDYESHGDRALRSEKQPHTANLKCEAGSVEGASTYVRDFVSWPEEDMELYRPQQCKPRHDLDAPMPHEKDPDISKYAPKIVKVLGEFYCPARCAGTEPPVLHPNCLTDYKTKFNLGPPGRAAHPGKESIFQKSCQPISKHTSYTLDYKPHATKPRQMPELNFRKSGLGLPSLPRDFATTHKEEFAWPPAGGASEPERGTTERISAFKVGEGGPMAEQSSHMLDYKDPHVGRTMPERPPKGIFRRPVCRFETQSETGASYPRWKDLPGQPAADLHKDNIRVEPAEHDARYLVSTYQEDYDGLPAALCPARMAENYGRRALEPKHRFACSANGHDYYQKGEDLAEKRD